LCKNKLTVVFGCGGNRDKGKRFFMGQISAKYCDRVIVTLDNPRDEEPFEIISNILSGIKESGFVDYYVIPDRKDAIASAINMMDAGDVTVIAGKGAEKYQEIKGVKRPFSDYEIALAMTRRQMDDN
jgi:UDP-N-acetylmuramoyl-L-alanyl-D-glutamate--2,6-diaminopimelate ligase